MMKKFLYILPFLIVTSACAQEQDINSKEMSTPSCVTYPEWTGQHVDQIDKSVLEGRAYRILAPDSMATMDFNPDRLNIKTDDDGVILMQECG